MGVRILRLVVSCRYLEIASVGKVVMGENAYNSCSKLLFIRKAVNFKKLLK